jgi:hypothetical protein
MLEQDQAIIIARDRASALGWAFAEPLSIIVRRDWFRGISRIEIETNAGKRGTKARFVIDAKTGEIVSEGYIRR